MTASSSAPPDGNSRASEVRGAAPRRSWFRTGEGRRYIFEIALIVVLKIALLVVLWFAFLHPWAGKSVPADTAVRNLYTAPTPDRHD